MPEDSTSKITRTAIYRDRNCVTCKSGFQSRSSKKIYCDPCGAARERAAGRRRAAARLRGSGAREVGSLVPCQHCSEKFTLACGAQKFCGKCSAERFNRWHRVKRSSDPARNLSDRMTRRMNSALRSGKQGRSWKSLVPYSIADLFDHLERQFLPGMSWANRSRWHVDHIVPVSSFQFEAPEDEGFQRCWALSNLRPLWSDANIRKSSRRTHLI